MLLGSYAVQKYKKYKKNLNHLERKKLYLVTYTIIQYAVKCVVSKL